ncbi:MAG: hypothetical protein CFE23_14710 [Flavobacterium sp. BFFFF1]|uniref:hypothetical protein n=1 Tax=Flavobacterium sp. BFFFF1 TaxID=2015557 RepID=UPI000BD8D211|nr:hypothetical protein [Flavobacterium sp. BFFFF1]OYU79296.1 MAG: hypothetical protein CFE23_14710 [Flavobacterium sp. BFFFF1]
MRKIIMLMVIGSLLMAFQCDDEKEPTIVRNNIKAKITSPLNLNVNDTIWLRGKVSSRVYDLQTKDSVFSDYPYALQMSIYRFASPTANYNAVDAINKFEIIYPAELVDFLDVCNNSTMTVYPTLTQDGSAYALRVGFKANAAGDYLFKFSSEVVLENADRNFDIIGEYVNPNNNYFIGFNSCGSYSWATEPLNSDICFSVN